MNNFQFVLLCLYFTLIDNITHASASPRSLTQYTIGNQRSPQISQLCSQVNRNRLYQKYSQQQPVQYESDIKRLFTLDRTLFNQFLNLDFTSVNITLKQSASGYILFVILPIVGLGLLLVSGLACYVLLFCPFKFCLRKKLIYSNFQQFCPMVFLTICVLATIGCCVTVLLSQYKIYGGYQELSCGSIFIFDDLLYGNRKMDDSSFFSGTKTIAEQLNIFNQQSNNIYGNLSSVSSNSSEITNSLSFMDICKTNISLIPTSNKSNLVLKYNTPLMQSSNNSTITSFFPEILGNYSDGQSLIGISYNAVDRTYIAVNSIRNAVDSFLITRDRAVDSTKQIIKFMNQTSSSLDVSLLTLNDMINRYSFAKLQYAEVLVYGLTILLILLLLVAQLFFIGYKRMCCRHFIYIISFFIFFVAAAFFTLSLGFGFAAPIAYTGTNYLNQTLRNKTAFSQLLQKFGSPISMGNTFSVCLSQGNGQILTAASSSQASGYVNLLRNVMTNLSAFDSRSISSSINNTYANLQSNLRFYSNSNILDINETNALNELKYVSKSINYGCQAGNFQNDSWIPNTVQKGNSIVCQTQFTIYADNISCPNSNKFATSSDGCTGCMSTSSLLYQFNSSASVAAYLGQRYTDCPKFNSDLANIWTNYYLVKVNFLEPVISRAEAVRPQIVQLQNKIKSNLGPLINNTLTQLYLSAQSVLNPKTGLLGGLNCGVIADDVAIFVSSLYKNTFSYCFHHMIYLSAISWLLLFVLWCNTCVLFRKKKDILSAINYPVDNGIVRAEPAPLSGDRLFHIQL